jgi:hypothetical protein
LKIIKTEIELARKVIEWLKDQRWEVYQEVAMGYGSPVADIVALRNNLTWVIETKMNLSLVLLEQAQYYIWHSNYTSIATPHLRHAKGRKMADMILRQLGVGRLDVGYDVTERASPKIHRINAVLNVKKYLVEAQKNYAEAGNPNGSRWSPFKATCEQVIAAVKKTPGLTLKELIDSIDHHYASSQTARSSLSHWIQEGIVKGIHAVRVGKVLRIYEDKDTKLAMNEK